LNSQLHEEKEKKRQKSMLQIQSLTDAANKESESINNVISGMNQTHALFQNMIQMMFLNVISNNPSLTAFLQPNHAIVPNFNVGQTNFIPQPYPLENPNLIQPNREQEENKQTEDNQNDNHN